MHPSRDPFPADARSAYPLFYRSYSRRLDDGSRESWEQVVERNLSALVALGNLNPEQEALLRKHQLDLTSLPSGRWLWVGGTPWAEDQRNFYGAYNCSSVHVDQLSAFGLLMNLAMQGTGTGAVLTRANVSRLPKVVNRLEIGYRGSLGSAAPDERNPLTAVHIDSRTKRLVIKVGDSRQGWVDSYQKLIDLACSRSLDAEVLGRLADGEIKITIDLGWVRPPGERLKGFGGVANPSALPEMYARVAGVLNRATGRQLSPLECCLIIDEAARCVVAGNIRRSAGMRQFDEDDLEAAGAKRNLWGQDEQGHWSIDPERDALRMANHTRLFHRKPTNDEVLEAVRSQHACGEGAIQFTPEALARANADILATEWLKQGFLEAIEEGGLEAGAQALSIILFGKPDLDGLDPEQRGELSHRMGRFGLNPCFAAGTMVTTREGHFPIETLIEKSVEVHDGKRWVLVDNFRVTGTDQPVFDLELYSGQVITATAYHSFLLEDGQRVALKDLQPGMRLAPATQLVQGTVRARAAYLKGFLIGDGTHDANQGTPVCKIYEPKLVCVDRLVASQMEMPLREMVAGNGRTVGKSYGLSKNCYLRNLNHEDSDWLLPWCSVYKREFPVDVLNWTPQCQHEFIAGLFDADGTAMDSKNGFAYQITSVSRPFLQGLGLLLTQIGIRWKIGPVRLGGSKDFGSHRGGVCQVQDTFRLTIPQGSSIELAKRVDFARLPSFADREAAYTTRDNALKVTSITPAGIAAQVYCCTVPDSHCVSLTCGALVGQCGEIIGSDFLCNLAEVHLNRLDPNDSGAVEEAFRSAALTVSVLLHHRFCDERMHAARLQDPIVGVSFTGLFDYFVRQLGVDWLRWWAEGRPPNAQGMAFSAHEVRTLRRFRAIVESEVAAYCEANDLRAPNRCTTVQPAGCLGLDALRVTSRGLLLFDEAKSHLRWCDASGDPLLVRGTVPMVDSVRNDPGPALRLTLVSGRQEVCTPDHRWRVNGAWVYARNLKIGDELEASPGRHSGRPVRIGAPDPVPAAALPPKAPNSLTPQLAYVAGVALIKNPIRVTWPALRNVADRCLHFSFPLTEEAACDRLNELFEDLFEAPLKRRLSGRTIHLFSRESPLRRWLEINSLLIADAPETDRLPLALRQSTTSTIRSFFAGLVDATACKMRNQPPVIKIQSEPLARHLQQVGEAVGLVFRLQRHQDGRKPYWKLTLSRYWSTAPALEYLAVHSLHCQGRDMRKTHNCFGHHYWQVAAIERIEDTVTADICLDADDDDAWYWAGAIKSHNSKSLLTNASPGWHPPKAPYYIRRITFAKDDPIALACLAYGYPIVPSQSDKDETGRLLSDPFDERCTEWLVEIPTATPWAELEGAAEIDTGKFPALAQFDFYMNVQKHYSGHNTSATLELTEVEIEPLATAIHTAIDTDQGYISAALLARFDDQETFPRMPFEPISKERYEQLCQEVKDRRASSGGQSCFFEALAHFDSEAAGGAPQAEGPAGCDSDRCLLPEVGPKA